MATGRRYYWIKLKDTFLSDDVIDFLMTQPEGAKYVVLYQTICLKTINSNGRLEGRVGEMIIPYNVDKIARECKWFSPDTVRVALELFKRIGLVYEDVNGSLVITGYDGMVGSETDYGEQKRRQRLEKKAEVARVDICMDNVHTEKEIEKEKDKEIKDNAHRTVKKSDYSDDFERVWDAYPRKKDKRRGYNAYCARKKAGWKEEDMLSAATGYASECRKQHTQDEYIKLCSTFFGPNEPFSEYISSNVVDDKFDDDNPFAGYE